MPAFFRWLWDNQVFTSQRQVKKAYEDLIADFLEKHRLELIYDSNGHAVKEVGITVQFKDH